MYGNKNNTHLNLCDGAIKYTEKDKSLKLRILINGQIHHIHGLEDSIV